MNTDHNAYDFLLKVLLIGDAGVGKSSLIQRYADEIFPETHQPTIGVDFKIKTIKVDGKVIKLQIWDTAGSERFRTLTSAYYKGAHGIIVVYDVTNKESFENVEYWLDEINNHTTNSNIPRLLIGNKNDDISNKKVDTSDAKNYASKLDLQHLETSAKLNNNVNEVFIEITQQMIQKHNLSSRKSVFVVNKSDNIRTMDNSNQKIKLDNISTENKKSDKNCC